MDINTLKQLITNQREVFLSKKNLIPREVNNLEKLIKSKEIVVITGVRRCGKSSLMSLIAQNLSDHNISKENILYLNFESEKFINFSHKEFDKIIDAYLQLHPQSKGKAYLFLDEIQNIKYWEKWLHMLYETGKYKIIVTGSNATLLSSEISTALTGRNIPIELFPFSFQEYLKIKGIDYKENDEYKLKNKALLQKSCNEYLVNGGFPEYIRNPDLNILNEYYKNILYRDIIGRYNIRNIKEFRDLSLHIISNYATLSTYRSLAKLLSISSANSVSNYIEYLENSYLIFKLPLLAASVKKQIRNPIKIYAIDNGMIKNVAFSISDNTGKLYENLVYLTLRRKKYSEIYYYKNNFEVDFVVKEKNRIKECIQVSFDINDKVTLEREKKALLECLNDLKMPSGIIINSEVEKEETVNRKKIVYIPLWKWLLKN